jgi:plasmid stability protein
MMTINLSDAQEAALAARAAAEGLSLQQWLKNLAEEVPADVPSAIDPTGS